MRPVYTAIRGFTLVEMIVVLGIFTVTMLTITSTIYYFYRSNAYSVEQSSAIISGRRGIEYLVRDLREATYAEDGAYPIVSIDDYEISFYADVDGTSDVEKVRYFIDGDLLKKGVIKASGNPLAYTGSETTTTVSQYVRSIVKGVPMFTYKDKDGVAVTNFSNIQDVRFVSASIIVNVNPNRLPEEFVLKGSAALRNLRE